jgi:hypothetical protein
MCDELFGESDNSHLFGFYLLKVFLFTPGWLMFK